MAAARDLLLTGLVDYAGLFPPAALPLDAVVETYARERTRPEAWMLGRLIVPAGRLPDLVAHGDALADGPPWRLSVLGHPPADEGPDAWIDAATQTLADARASDRVRSTVTDRFELRLPSCLAADADALAGALSALDPHLSDAVAVALEVPYMEHPATTEPAAHAIAEANRRSGEARWALKLRCGGVTPETLPSVEALAHALTAAWRAGVAVKATAGLHHPLRGMADVGGAPMHGFVNVFGGAALAARHRLDADALAEVLDDGEPRHWRLDDTLAWRSLTASSDDVARARTTVALSFGSCSFDEPRDDLRALGWL